MRTVLFYRNFRRFHGGHLKVWDYFSHVLASPEFTPRIEFSLRSNWDRTNPWWNAKDYVVDSARSVHPDVFFVEGRDWQMMDEHPYAGADIPVVNLVQHVRHADPKSDRFPFLIRKAIRICVSEEVARALRATGLTRGPLIVIPIGMDLEDLPTSNGAKRDIDVVVAALKQPDLGEELGHSLRRPGRRVEVLSRLLPRSEYLSLIQRARTTVFLPNEAEGFYLPPLEGMAMGTLVVCPVHAGERSIYLPGHNCFRPNYIIEELVQATESALALPPDRAKQILANARQTAEAHSLLRERRAFLDVLHNVDQLWAAIPDAEHHENQAGQGWGTKARRAVPTDDSLFEPILTCDEPAQGSTLTRGTLVSGWAYSPVGILEVSIRLNGQRVGQAEQGFKRPDVVSDHPEWPGAERSGFRYRFEEFPFSVAAPSADLVVVAEDGLGRRAEVSRVVRTAEPSPPPIAGAFDIPKAGDRASLLRGKITSKWQELSKIRNEILDEKDEAELAEHRKRRKSVRQEMLRLENELRAVEEEHTPNQEP
jgi:hypothetical protein